jgi:D-alanine-D-alanine ligase
MGGEYVRPSKVWVLFGGWSAEREVSLRTGQGIVDALRAQNYATEGFDVRAREDLLRLDWQHPPDLVYLGFHGTFGEDGTVQGFLEAVGVPYTGSGVTASALCFHKGLAKRHLAQFGVPCPVSHDFHGRAQLEAFLASPKLTEFLGRKWFIKAARQGSTIGIERYEPSAAAGSPTKYFRLLADKVFQYDDYVLVEEWLEGPELTVPVVFGQAYPIIEIRPLSQFYDYSSKYTAGKTEYLCPAPISAEAAARTGHLAAETFRLLECEDYARADFILTRDGPKFLEMNTLPGMTGTSLVPKSAAAAGQDYATFVGMVAERSYSRWKAGGRTPK